ncbi:MAG: OmpA family protein [Alphaproteobacteria bacterium]|nr:OmpA family protein [Alphaproteobacteria bacterium]
MAEEEKKKAPPKGAPSWMVTFADLMTLLLCFFVLLLSFSTMEITKFEEMLGSVDNAFGVTKKRILAGFVEVDGTPISTDMITELTIKDAPITTHEETEAKPDEEEISDNEFEEYLKEEQEKLLQHLSSALGEELKNGVFTAELKDSKVIIHFPNSVAFLLGSDEINPKFVDTLKKLSSLLEDTEGDITIAGHTDNQPISTKKFKSNWELSSARALSVLHVLEKSNIERNRFAVEGRADTKPLASNETADGRANNRRVDIILNGPAKEDVELVTVPVKEKVRSLKEKPKSFKKKTYPIKKKEAVPFTGEGELFKEEETTPLTRDFELFEKEEPEILNGETWFFDEEEPEILNEESWLLEEEETEILNGESELLEEEKPESLNGETWFFDEEKPESLNGETWFFDEEEKTKPYNGEASELF